MNYTKSGTENFQLDELLGSSFDSEKNSIYNKSP